MNRDGIGNAVKAISRHPDDPLPKTAARCWLITMQRLLTLAHTEIERHAWFGRLETRCRWIRAIFSIVACSAASLLYFTLLPSTRADEEVDLIRQRLADSLKFLSSDELAGRGVGTAGLERAAQFIAAEFTQLGLKTDLIAGRPFQTFEIDANSELGSHEKNFLTLIGPPNSIDGDPQRIDLQLGSDFHPLALGGSGQFDLPLVFVGYGITGVREQYDDYAGVDVKGKAVLIIRKEPQQDDPQSVFNGRRNSQHAYFRTKVANSYSKGAAAVILLNDSVTVEQIDRSIERNWDKAVDQLTASRQAFKKLVSPTQDELVEHRQEISRLVQRIQQWESQRESAGDRLLGLLGAGQGGDRAIPVFFCRRQAMESAIRSGFGDKDLAAIEREIDEHLVPRSAPLTGWRVVGQSHVIRRKIAVKNVVAVLEAEGPFADETVVIGAHYDHLGMGGPGSLAPWTAEIHNGADDNASGSAALLELARHFATRPSKPRRRLVFIAFTAEERGLLGSARYVREPRFPLEKTVAMVNLDMIGRLTDDRVIIQGTGTATEFDGLINELNRKYGFQITKRTGGYGPSDHSSFYAKRIPVLHVYTGTHSDYHRPSDDFEKINLDGMRRITQLVGELVASIADADERPHFKAISRNRRRGSSP